MKNDPNVERRFVCKEWITVEEMGRYLGIGRSTAYELVRNKDFPIVKIGRVIRISVTDLNHWLERQRLLNSGTR